MCLITSRTLLLDLSTRRILLCLPIISMMRVAWISSPISFLLETVISTIRSFSICSIDSITAPCKYFLKTMIKVEGWAGFSKVVSVNWMRPKTGWAERSRRWLWRLLRICKTNSWSKGWLIFWMRPFSSSARNSSTMWCKKNPSMTWFSPYECIP